MLGGVAVYEAQAHWITRELDKLAASIDAENADAIEFHASEVFSGRTPPWDRIKKDQRKQVIKDVLGVLPRAYESCCAFSCAIEKACYPGVDPMALAFEDLCSRFDIYLDRMAAGGDRQRGLIILDKSSYETSLQKLARQFRQLGAQWGVQPHVADTAMFIDSRASRIVQLADHIAYATFRRYESGDSSYFDIIAARFFEADGVVHGLAHKQLRDPQCMCPACLRRRQRARA